MRAIISAGLLFIALTATGALRASEDVSAAGMSMQTPPTMRSMAPNPSMGNMAMHSSVDLNDPMSQESSGTAWMPSSQPLYAWMRMRPNGDMAMLHGAAMPRYTDVGSRRGDRRADAPNWFMGMYSHSLGEGQQLGLHAMMSLDPITEGGHGYPLLYQTGETWHGQPLRDRQHPHDLFDELSATYSHLTGHGDSVFFYAAYPGEPALGPPTYMHRALASDLADAPIGHHWQDATHITFGVLTAGYNIGSRIKVEASDFTGREPDENRYSFDRPRFDSDSARLSYNPGADDAFQVSYGYVRNPEGSGANVDRTTASWVHNRPLAGDANMQTALVWGQNDLSSEGISESYLAEADYQHGRDTLFTRLEYIQKSGSELVLPMPLNTSQLYNLGAYTVGYVRDLSHGSGVDTGLGIALTMNSRPSSLDPIYGGEAPPSFEIYFRLRPSRNGLVDHESTVLSTPVASGLKIAASLNSPDPKLSSPSKLTVILTDSSGMPVSGATVSAAVAMKTMDMGTAHVAMAAAGDGAYTGNVSFGMAGPWRVTVTAKPMSGKAMSQAFDFDVK